MGKLSAALIIVFTAAWLGPMCARLPSDLTPVAVPAPPVAPIAPAVSTATVAVPEPAAEPPKPAPAAKRPSLTVATYNSRKMFPVEKEKYVVSVLRANKADVPAVGVTMTLTTHMKGQLVERAESGPGQSLAAGSTSYFGLTVSTLVFDEILDGPDEPGTDLEWSLSYRFENDAPETKRCFRLKALPRRRAPEGITWRALGSSHKCEPGTPQ